MGTLVLIRHGESVWNSEGLFTGWVDVGLSPKGVDEAVGSGRQLEEAGLRPDVVHTSVLTRAIQTAHLALEAADLLWLPVERSWRLNERHYGALQGKNKAQTREQYGDEQFMLWRRSYDVPPPPIDDDAIVPDLAAGRTVLVVAHGNSIRALVKHLDEIGDAEIAGVDIPTGMPLVYEISAEFRPQTRGGRYLDPQAAAAGAEAVKNQGR
jgi:2,3-bisphosphoglycerate-dependent phosphoglycerate mutase